MPIHFEHTIEVSQPPQQVFATLADVSQTPKWLSRCTGIELVDPGPLAVGSKLRYSYRDGSRSGTMDGQVVERVENQKLAFRYDDAMMQVGVQFAIKPAGKGTRLTHTIDITPRKFMAKLFSPLIRRQLPTQTMSSMESLRKLLAKPSGETAKS